MEQFLIERLQNFTLDRKVLSVDSNDRDKSRWPNANEFEVSLPQTYSNVESIRLLNVQIPNRLYNICEHLQNNKMIIQTGSNKYMIILDDGYYNNTILCKTIENKINSLLTDAEAGVNPRKRFKIVFNPTSLKPHFVSDTIDFSLIFLHSDISYNNSSISPCSDKIYDQHSNWGLGSNLGFNNKNWVESHPQSDSSNSEIYDYYNDIVYFHDISASATRDASGVIIPPNQTEVNQNQFIYLEVDKYNTSDEIKPFINDRLNNTNTGLINSYFAKIPIKYNIFNENSINQSLSCKDDFIDSFSYYQPPIEKISKLKIKFRYHNGLLVDLGNLNVSLSIEINQIRNEMKNYDVRKPFRL